ncbi:MULTISPECIES: tetratricopeptide repeat protein [Dyella]|uniref:Tetratricopeptide repeat protein n=2 Tax=Dyella TaxID=231454 RepID=A0A4R0YNB1_9GAMM|nr:MULTISPECIES: tetratricopeptide repeat protein [Dyella]TBR37114.1 tetratricopeptide repeat protein [Dyella terrae]TCI07796.1 tetratricopeptide repeat protein [Dyella soli]
MSYRLARTVLLTAVVAGLAITACTRIAEPEKPARAVPSDAQMIASIRAAGDREKSIIDVNPLRDPGVTMLQDGAGADERRGAYQDAADKLDQALKLSPNSPDLLQERAEVAIRLKDYPRAEQLARKSWELGPRLGPLCARNWQTIKELRFHAGDDAGAATADKWVKQCHVEGVPRY